MAAVSQIPDEIRARVEANAFFGALRAGDYNEAAVAQERLLALGWRLTREPATTRQAPGASSTRPNRLRVRGARGA